MSIDIVDRLRNNHTPQIYTLDKDAMRSGADTIESLRKRVAELRTALEYAADQTKPEGLSGCDCPICKALSRTDDTSTLDEYRNKVIDECLDMLENGNQSIASLKR